jgi:2,4-dienoyl-CoA reductase-like NADH-dependent reductase (Old Yellow Enzyme family)
LFDPILLGATLCPNRIVMAPMTRGRATRDHVPTALMAEYYAQRASAGLILTEATGISREGLGWPFGPGIWNQAQVEGWKKVVGSVREAGGRIFCQLWHMGRTVHPSFLDGQKPVSASATRAPGKAHSHDGRVPHAPARALGRDEIKRVVDDYAHSARLAMAAGFDGVQLHGANGYLIDQFLRDGTNFRDDDYGGPIENRIRLLVEAARAIADIVGPDRTAIRLSPNSETLGCADSDPHALFAAAAAALEGIGIAFLELSEPGPEGTFGKSDLPPVAPAMRRLLSAPMILNSDFDPAAAQTALAEGRADAISFGRPFIANPDLPERLAAGAALAKDDMARWGSEGPGGYTDYPRLTP